MASVECDVFIVGCGYLGRRVARAEQARGRRCAALTHSEQSAAELSALGITPVRGDLDQADSVRDLDLSGTLAYYFVPPQSNGSVDLRVAAFCDVLDRKRSPTRLVAVSTTGVYGDCGGEWVDETRLPEPRAERSRRRLDMEMTLRGWGMATATRVVTLRVPGIYGPHRLPRERIARGVPVLAESESPWSNRIHVDDLVTACLAALDRGHPGRVINAADGKPSTMTDYFNHVADAVSLPRPPQISHAEATAQLSAGMLSYLAESKRIDITRMRNELGVTPRYDLVDGLAASIAQEQSEAAA
ncbi:MAG: SDR family oxidoreductase [Gammaproteobacteria bacterium]